MTTDKREFSTWFFRAPDFVMIAMLSALLFFLWDVNNRLTRLESRPCPCHTAAILKDDKPRIQTAYNTGR